MSSISIPHNSLLDSLETLHRLGAVLGQDAVINTDYTLQVQMTHIDDLIIQQLRQNPAPEPPERIAPPERIDRVILLDNSQEIERAQIEANFLEAWEAASNPEAQTEAYEQRNRERRELRLRAISPFVQLDVLPERTLVYGTGRFDFAECIPRYDGRSRQVHTLIHHTHPTSPEELWLREHKVIAERIIRYRIKGLDDADWDRQNQPRGEIDAKALRGIVARSVAERQNGNVPG